MKISNIIITILAVILLGIVINTATITIQIKKFKTVDGYFINKLGQIRGSIQRYSKLKLVNNKLNKSVEKNIDKFFIQIDKSKELFFTNQNNLKKFNNMEDKLKSYWNDIKRCKDKNNLILLSESAWLLADKINLFNQHISSLKNKKLIKTIYLISIASIVILLIAIFIVYFFIKHGLEKDKITDPLTQLYNRRYMFDILEKLIKNYFAYKTPFSLIFIDIDNFKKINDTYGHNEGDRILQEVSKTIKKIIRKNDYAFRYGGEELVIILPNTNLDEAIRIAERIREKVSNDIKMNNNSITISLGVSEYEGEDKFEFIEKSDSLMYKAKQTGKNRVVYN